MSFIVPTLVAKIALHLLDCEFGMNLKVCGRVYLRPNGKNSIVLGNNVKLIARFLTNSVGLTNPILLECIEDGKIIIGNNSGLSSVVISSRNSVRIGNNVNIGGNVRIFDHDYHSLNFMDRRKGEIDFLNVKTERVIIDDDVFIGTNAIILKGVKVGARSIVAAGSVVFLKNIPEDSLVSGNPAIIIRTAINKKHV
ncbi:MAG: acyltransferase [Bacteroidota bacterium]|nr:acyltransferase [Bacteroidota bacterium]